MGGRQAKSGDNHASAGKTTVLEVVDGVVDVRQLVFSLVHFHLAVGVQFHQFDQFDVVAYEAAADLDLVGHQFQRRDLDLAAISDHDELAALP